MIVEKNSSEIKRENGFIVFEGVNGCGKSTARKTAARLLAEMNISAVETFEPGSGTLGGILRPLILGEKAAWRSPIAELLLFGADRAGHVTEVIKPALEENHIVLCDRYYYSTVAFQGYGRGVDLSLIKTVNDSAVAGVVPDLVLLFDLDPLIGLKRTLRRAPSESGDDSFEKEDLAFHNRIRSGYLELARTALERFVIIDASRELQVVEDAVIKVLEHYLR
ncbi:MAG: dTMP kinase [Deltaproteobacteria bacterium]|nr:dTMP kinase [Deltaproteobacteria bacterium]